MRKAGWSAVEPTRPRVGVALLLLTLGTPPSARAADLPTPSVFEANADRVEVDFVVRDRDGALLRDLRRDEVAVFEDGVRQEIASFDLVEIREGGERGTAAAAAPPVFLAIALDRLSPAARLFAQQAVIDHLASEDAPSAVGVFSIDRGLKVLLPFTEDRDAVRRVLGDEGVRSVTSWSGLADRELVRRAWHGLGEGFGQAHVAAAESEGPAECRTNEDVQIRVPELMESQLVEAFQSLERDQEGQGTAHALLALVGGLGKLPGRKAVLLLSEGLAMPDGAEEAFQAVIAAAQRARVSVYTADAGGLRVTSAADEMRRALDNLSTRRHATGDGGVVQKGLLTLLEENEDALRLAPATRLGPWRFWTGGRRAWCLSVCAGCSSRARTMPSGTGAAPPPPRWRCPPPARTGCAPAVSSSSGRRRSWRRGNGRHRSRCGMATSCSIPTSGVPSRRPRAASWRSS